MAKWESCDQGGIGESCDQGGGGWNYVFKVGGIVCLI